MNATGANAHGNPREDPVSSSSLPREDAMSTHLDTLKAGLHVCYGVVFLVLILWVFPDIRSASKVLLDRAASASSLEVVGFKVAFTETTVAQGLVLADVPAGEQKPVLDAIHSLNSREFVRLMAVGQLANLCEYDRPTPTMRNDVALDYDLQEKGLTKIEPSRTILESVQAWHAKVTARGERIAIGAPRNCYQMTLTDVGSRVKTVIVQNLAPAFNNFAPAANKLIAMN
jgi:hypothetical protein